MHVRRTSVKPNSVSFCFDRTERNTHRDSQLSPGNPDRLQLITYFGSTLYCTEKNRVHGMEPEHLPVARMAARARARAYSL